MRIASAIVLVFSSLVLFTGLLFKIMHWPRANEIILLGAAVLAIFGIPLHFIGLYVRDNKKDRVQPWWQYTLGGIMAELALFMAIFYFFHWPGWEILGGVLVAMVVLNVVLTFLKKKKETGPGA